MELFNSPVLIRHQEQLEKSRNAIEKRDLLIEQWNYEEQSFFFPSGRWASDDRTAPIFTFRALALFLFLFLLLLPTVVFSALLLFYFGKIYRKRDLLRIKIQEKQMIVKGTLPIPLSKEEYENVQKTYWGQKFIKENIFFLKTSVETPA